MDHRDETDAIDGIDRLGGRDLSHDHVNGNGRRNTADGVALQPGGRTSFRGFDVLSLASQLQAAHRLMATGDAERERIERDLHDGVQQRLTALRVRLAIAAEGFDARGDKQVSAALNEFGDEVELATEELRDFAHGVYPALLTSSGLGPALASAATRGPEPVSVRARGLRRYRPEVESAVYFSCLAAMHNAARHAGPADVTVSVWDNDRALCFRIRDTGCGFDARRTRAGAGMANMHDRIAAVGGTLTIQSTPAHGTRLDGAVPHA